MSDPIESSITPDEVAPTVEPEITPIDLAAQLKAERQDFFKRLNGARKQFNILLSKANDHTINGKTLLEWNDYCRIPIPENPDLVALNICMSKLAAIMSHVGYQYEQAALTHTMLKREIDDARAKKFTTIKGSKTASKAFSNEYTNAKVDVDLAEQYNMLMFAGYIVEFWESKRQHLISVRKILEAMFYGVGSEMRSSKNFIPDNGPIAKKLALSTDDDISTSSFRSRTFDSF